MDFFSNGLSLVQFHIYQRELRTITIFDITLSKDLIQGLLLLGSFFFYIFSTAVKGFFIILIDKIHIFKQMKWTKGWFKIFCILMMKLIDQEWLDWLDWLTSGVNSEPILWVAQLLGPLKLERWSKISNGSFVAVWLEALAIRHFDIAFPSLKNQDKSVNNCLFFKNPVVETNCNLCLQEICHFLCQGHILKVELKKVLN